MSGGRADNVFNLLFSFGYKRRKRGSERKGGRGTKGDSETERERQRQRRRGSGGRTENVFDLFFSL